MKKLFGILLSLTISLSAATFISSCSVFQKEPKGQTWRPEHKKSMKKMKKYNRQKP